jgi:hypothetical protein
MGYPLDREQTAQARGMLRRIGVDRMDFAPDPEGGCG